MREGRASRLLEVLAVSFEPVAERSELSSRRMSFGFGRTSGKRAETFSLEGRGGPAGGGAPTRKCAERAVRESGGGSARVE